LIKIQNLNKYLQVLGSLLAIDIWRMLFKSLNCRKLLVIWKSSLRLRERVY